MTDTKISALTDGTPLQNGDLFVVARGASDVKITLDRLNDLALSVQPTGAIAESFSRSSIASATAAFVTTGTLNLVAIALPKGITITSISFVSGTTALASGTHQIFGLYDSSGNLLRGTSDDTSTAWAASAAKTLTLTSTFTTTYEGLHYLACLVVATTVPTFTANGGQTGATAISPRLTVRAGASLTALPSTAALTASSSSGNPYAWVS